MYDSVMYDFVMHDFSVYTGITKSCVISFSSFIHEKKKMEEDNIASSLCIIIIASAILRIRRDRRRPRVWARSWICRRARYGAHHSLIKELSSEDPKGFKNFIRMDTSDF